MKTYSFSLLEAVKFHVSQPYRKASRQVTHGDGISVKSIRIRGKSTFSPLLWPVKIMVSIILLIIFFRTW